MSNSNNYRAELLKLMKENKIYQLPINCPCRYSAKDGNWIDMEKHYEKCSQYRNHMKVQVKKLKK